LRIQEISKVLFDTATEGLLITNGHGTIQTINPRIEELFGYTKDELVGQKVEVLIPAHLRHGHVSQREKYHQKPSKRTMGQGLNLLGQCKDGSTVPIEISLNHFEINNEQMVMALISDISKRVEILKQLQKEKETEQMYLDIAGTMFVILDENFGVKLINQKGAAILGLTSNEVLQQNWLTQFTPEHQHAKFKSFLQPFLQKKQRGKFEGIILNDKQEELIISWNLVSVTDENGNINGILGSGEDITQQKLAEQKLAQLNIDLEYRVNQRTKALEKSQMLYKMIARNFPNGVINVLDSQLNYIFVEGQELYKNGITNEKLVGTSYLERLNPNYITTIKEHLTQALNGVDTSFELETENGIYNMSAVGLKEADESISQVLVVEQNITKQKNAELEMIKALDKERELNELKSRFVSMASHEFRTPLTTVLSSANLMTKYAQNSDFEERQEKQIGRIKSSVRQLTNLLEDFLSIEKLEAGKIAISPSLFELQEWMNDLVEEMNLQVKNGQIIVCNQQGSDTVWTDKKLLKNILYNLISNAIKYSPEDQSIDITVQVNTTSIDIQVQDGGIGIPEEEQAQLFERFFRAKNVTNIQGTGLGLSIVKKYIELLKGQISFTSEYGKGSNFRITIPNTKPEQ
jgi:PAS domain S-box-containing protein